MKFKLLLFLASLSFSITAKAQYCAPDLIFGCILGDQVDDFTVTGINSTSISDLNTGCAANNWEVDMANTVTFAPGGSYAATVVSGTTDDNVEVWIDFNDDFTFSSGESVGGLNGVGISTLNFNISIPMGATVGTHTMRIFITGDGTYPGIDPCPELVGGYGTGEVHDYTAVISSGTVCNPPTGVVATAITHDGATINWAAVTGAIGYEYVVDQVAGNPSVAGTGISLTSHAASGLMSGTLYYFHVRTNCGGGNFSTWVTIPFTTLACPAPTGVTETAVTATSATISWTAVTGAQGYHYAVTTSMTPPTTGGNYTTNGSVPVTGLTALTTYHTWVRTVCGAGDTSAWNTMHMWTTLPVSVVNVGNTDFLLEAYPNPAKNTLTIAAIGKGSVTATIQLTDITGKAVNSYVLVGEQMNIDLSGLSSGVYFIRYADTDHRQTIKIIKE